MSTKNKGDIKKQSDIIQQIKESQTLDKKHKEMTNFFNSQKVKEEELTKENAWINPHLRSLLSFY